MNNLLEAIKKRRSYYGIGGERIVPEERIEELVKEAVKYVPSAFNSQSARVVVLFGQNHKKLWDITEETLRKIVPEGQFASTERKWLDSAAAMGQPLFEDDAVIKSLQEQFELYKDNFPIWSQQSQWNVAICYLDLPLN